MMQLVRCGRCAAEIPAESLDTRRCLTQGCWLPTLRMANARRLGQLADALATVDRLRNERLASAAQEMLE